MRLSDILVLPRGLSRSFRALALCLVSGFACSGSSVSVEVTFPGDIEANWIEVAAYKGSSCAAIAPMLGSGVPDGATARVAFQLDGKQRPKFGEIPSGIYAFGAVARNSSCTVLATGCKAQDVSDSKSVTIPLTPVSRGGGTCSVGTTCQAGMCVPANDNANPSVGASCSLELIGSGPLPNPIARGGTMMSAPAIAVTSTGFVIAYRQVGSSASEARLILLPLDSSGGAAAAATPQLPDRCPDSDEIDGVGLVVTGDAGKITIARRPCTTTKPALELLNFTTTTDTSVDGNPRPGPPTLGKFLISESPNDVSVSLAPSRSSTARPSGDLVVFTEGGVGRIANIDPTRGIVGPNGNFGGTSGVKDAWVASNDKVLALLAAAPGTAPTSPVPTDAGADGGDAGTPTPPSPAPDSELRLLVLPVSTPVDSIDASKNAPKAPTLVSGSWGSLATLGGRVIVFSDNLSSTGLASFRAYDLGNDFASDSQDFPTEGDSAITAGDVFALGNRAYFATLKPQNVTLSVYDNATTTLTPLRDVSFARVPRISAINTVRDGRVAVAATDRRVAVAWTTATVLGEYDGAGGYAVFACTQ